VKIKRFLIWPFASTIGLALLAAAALYWASRSETLLAWGVDFIAASLPCALSIEGMQGAVTEPLVVEHSVCENADFRVEAHNVALVWSPWELVTSRRISVVSLRAESISFSSKSAGSGPLKVPDEFAMPIAVDVDLVEIGSILIASDGAAVELDGLNASYNGDSRLHRLTLHGVASQWGRARAEITIGTSAPLPIAAKAAIESSRLEDWPISAEIDVSGNLRLMTATLQGSAGQLRVAGEIALAPLDASPVVSLAASTSDVDIAWFDPRLPHTAVAATMLAQSVGTSTLRGTLRTGNAQSGRLDQQRLPVQRLAAGFELDTNALRLSAMQIDLGPAGRATGSAVLALDHMTLALDVSQLDLKAAHAGLHATNLTGSVGIGHRENRQLVTLDLRQKDMRLEGNAEVTPERVDIQHMLVRAGGAQLRTSGSVGLDEHFTYALECTLDNFDPALFGDFPQARINGTLHARGQLRPEWQADLQYKLGPSQLTGVPIAGSGALWISPWRLRQADMQLDYGGNALSLTGSFGASGDALAFRVDARRLDRLDKRATGRAQASGTLTGTLERPAVTADIQAQEIGFEEFRIGDAMAEILVEHEDDPTIQGQVSLRQLARGEFALETVDASIDGTLAAHGIDLAVAAPHLQLNSRIEGGWDVPHQVWTGVMTKLENAGDYPFKITRAATLELAKDRALLGATDVQFDDAELTFGSTRFEEGSLLTKGTVRGVRAARVLALMKEPPAIDSTLVLAGRWEIRADESLHGFVELTRMDGDVVIPGDEPLALELEELHVTLHAVANRISAEAVLHSTQIDGTLSAQTHLEKRNAQWGVPGTAPLNLKGQLEMQSIRPIAALASRSVTADGSLRLTVTGSGTVAAPRFTGRVEGDSLLFEDVARGVFFRDGTLRASFGDDSLTLSEFTLQGGQGELNVRGTFAARAGAPVMELEWSASELTVMQHPDLRLTVSGAGEFEYKQARLSLTGELTADQGRVELRNRTFPALGADVVVSGYERNTQIETTTRRADLDMQLDLGTDFTVVGRGLNARMAGRIRLTSSAYEPLTADGEIRVASGTFEAYGRRLRIEQGILFFSGPVNNPGLNIRAMRKNQPVEAGVEVTGTARNPRVLLVSDPEVSDPDKLAWLVLGRQAETGNAQDNQALQSSAVALAAGLGTTPLQQQLTQIVGVDEINFVPGAGQSQGGVVAVGKQISDKVYVTQEFGLSAAGNTLRVSYQLSRRWSLRTESGETDAVDVFFTLSFD